jgi:hypothetical protein
MVKKIGKGFDKILKGWVDSSSTYRATYDNNVTSIIESILERANRN